LQAWAHGNSAGLRPPIIMRRKRKPARNEELEARLIAMIAPLCGGIPENFPLATKLPREIKRFLKRDPSAGELNAAVVRLLAAAIERGREDQVLRIMTAVRSSAWG
jgi:hypothetical protein